MVILNKYVRVGRPARFKGDTTGELAHNAGTQFLEKLTFNGRKFLPENIPDIQKFLREHPVEFDDILTKGMKEHNFVAALETNINIIGEGSAVI